MQIEDYKKLIDKIGKKKRTDDIETLLEYIAILEYQVSRLGRILKEREASTPPVRGRKE